MNQTNDNEGLSHIDIQSTAAKPMPDDMKQCKKHFHDKQTISKSIRIKTCYYPCSTRNPYDDDTSSSTVIEDWDEECQIIEPYYYPRYIRRAQWPNHWRWTPPLGIRRTCTQQLHRNLGFERLGLYDDIDCSSLTLNLHHLTFDFR